MKEVSSSIDYVEISERHRSKNPLASMLLLVQELKRARFVSKQLFLRDFKAQFKQKLLGYFWMFGTPLLGISSFLIMSFSGALQPGPIGMPYVIFALSGTTFWGVLVNSISSLNSSIINQGDLILRTNIPKISVVLASSASMLYGLLINLIVLIVLSLLVGQTFSFFVILLPLLLIPLFLIGFGIGLVLSVVNVIMRDISTLVTTAFSLLMFLCPVIYMPSFSRPEIQKLIEWNPLYHLIDLPRKVIYFSDFSSLAPYLYSVLFSIVAFTVCVHIYYQIEDLASERI